MKDFDEDPLDLFSDDGDGVNEMCLLFDKDGKKDSQRGNHNGNSGCCALLFSLGLSGSAIGWGIALYFV